MSAITWSGIPAGTSLARVRTSRQRTSRLRITRRGRVVLTAIIAIPLAAAAVVGGMGAVGATATEHHASTTFSYATVAPGESLWQLAEQVAPNADPRDVVAAISDLNSLSSGVVQPGQRLAIPAQYAH